MTWPMLFGILSLLSFQLIDSAFIGQLGIEPLAAQGFTLPIHLLVIGLQVGLGIATTSIISKALGANQLLYAKQLAGLVLIIGGIGIAVFCLALWLLRQPILVLLGAPEEMQSIIDGYWPYWLMSTWIGAILYFYYSIIRANGNTMLPGSIMIITSLLNIALDPIFIFTLELGLNGAAIATIIAFLLGLLIMVPRVNQNDWVTVDWKDLDVIKSVKEIGHIMGPAMVSQLLPPVSSILATKLVAGFGTAAVAAWALGSRYELFVIVPILALTMSMPPMVGRLLGAKNFVDIKQLVLIACRFIMVFQFAIALLTLALAHQLAEVMASDPEVSDILNTYLLLVPFSLGPLGICMLMVSVSNALGKAYSALTMSSLRLFAFFLPSIWLGAMLANLYGIFIGVMVGNTLAGLCAWYIYKRVFKKIEH